MHPLTQHIRKTHPVKRTLYILVPIILTQKSQSQKNPSLDKFIVYNIHSLQLFLVRWQIDFRLNAIGNIVEADGCMDGVVAIFACVVDGGVAGYEWCILVPASGGFHDFLAELTADGLVDVHVVCNVLLSPLGDWRLGWCELPEMTRGEFAQISVYGAHDHHF
jgi:hypothetical protein